jgi:hypothetical protein
MALVLTACASIPKPDAIVPSNTASWLTVTGPGVEAVETRNFKSTGNDKFDEKKVVVGVRVDYNQKQLGTSYSILVATPIPVPFDDGTMAFYWAGRNSGEDLTALFRSTDDKEYSVPVSSLNFSGWKKLVLPLHHHKGEEFLGFVLEDFVDYRDPGTWYFNYFSDVQFYRAR